MCKQNNNSSPILTFWHYAGLLICLIMPQLAWAHLIHSPYQGFLGGWIHPFSGWDHTVTTLAVGIIAAQRQNSWRWTLPLLFGISMLLGGVSGHLGIEISWFEFGISLSVFILGICLSAPSLLPNLLLATLVGIFAFCHGFAHAAEMPLHSSWGSYASGFILATAVLLLTGFAVGKVVFSKSQWLTRFAGLSMVLSALWLH